MKCLKKMHIPAILLILFFLPFAAFAGIRSDRPSQVQGLLTSLGTGASLAYNLGDHFLVGANYFAANVEGEGDNTDKNETIKVEFTTSELFLRYYLFENAGFYISGASVFRNWKITLDGSDYIGDSGVKANYQLTAEWPTTAFSYGVGYNWIASFGLSGGLFLGMISGGEPELKGKVDNAAISQADVDKEIDEIEKKEKFGEKYSNVPIFGFTIGYNF